LTHRHREKTGLVVFERQVLVLERLEPPDTRRAGAVAVEKISALAHEVRDLFITPRREPKKVSDAMGSIK
jgi:hypothetical protein